MEIQSNTKFCHYSSLSAGEKKDDDLFMVFMTHYNPYNLSYVTANDVRFMGCELNGFFGNYSGLNVTFENTNIRGTVVNLKADP